MSSTKDLPIANDLYSARQRWIDSIAKFDQDLKRFIQSDVAIDLMQQDAELKSKIEATSNLWYVIKPRIESVKFGFDEYLSPDLDTDTLLPRLARPAPDTTPFVEVRYSALLSEPLVASGSLEHRQRGRQSQACSRNHRN